MANLIGLLERRLLGATAYSLAGLKACFRNEEAFRVEVFIGIILCLASPWLANSIPQWVALVGVVLVVMIVELLNSGIEATIDRIGPEQHELSKRAKDMGSAAVFLSFVLLLVVWCSVMLNNFLI